MPKNLANGHMITWKKIHKMQLEGLFVEISESINKDQRSLPHFFIRGIIESIKFEDGTISTISINQTCSCTASEKEISQWESISDMTINCKTCTEPNHKDHTAHIGIMQPWMDNDEVVWFRTLNYREAIIYPASFKPTGFPYLYFTATELSARENKFKKDIDDMVVKVINYSKRN